MNKAPAHSKHSRHIPTHKSKAEKQTDNFLFSQAYGYLCVCVSVI